VNLEQGSDCDFLTCCKKPLAAPWR